MFDITTTELLKDLVTIPSVNPMGATVKNDIYGEKAIAEYIADFFRKLSLDYEIYEVHPGRPNVVATWLVNAKLTILLEAHTDTVDGKNMVIDPFSGKIKNGCLYGRGACDTKSSLAAMLMAMYNLKKHNRYPTYNLVLAAVADEEYGFRGAKALMKTGLKADLAIVGEPTELSIVNAHKGVVRWRITTYGVSVHSAYAERGENAIYAMAAIIHALQDYARELSETKRHPRLGCATLSVGTIHGGTAVNIVPDRCTIEIDRRILPDETLEQAQNELVARLPDDINYEISEPLVWANGLDSTYNASVVQRLQQAAAPICGLRPVTTANYATDAGVYHQAGIPTVVFGPGSIEQAHTSGEFVELQQVETAVKIFEKVCEMEHG
ncbi:MAG: M20 family peptidase [Calditrichaeota bacterium]|nr:MAG: M20 family peptidase [Calditrichota bacterium]